MKKVLFTTTALVASAGFAMADGHLGVALSGNAEMGVADNGNGNAQFHTDIDVTFKLSGETDGGLSFGSAIDIDEGGSGAAAVADDADDGGIAVFLKGGFGTLTLGDTDGAFDKALKEVAMGTAIADDHTAHGGYSGNSGFDGDGDGQILRYDYSFGDFGVAISYEQGDNGATSDMDIIGVGATFSTDLGGTTLGIGLGYQTQDSEEILGASVAAGIAGFDVVINYSDDSKTGEHTAIGLGYSVDAISVHANYGENNGTSGYGANVNYDLGGGAVLAAGYGSTDGGNDTWSLGVRMDF